MKIALLGLLLGILTYEASAQDKTLHQADAIAHIWQTQDHKGKMQVYKEGNHFNGKMLYGEDLLEADGKTYKKDVHNPDPSLRSKSLENYVLFTGLTYRDNKWVNGKIYYFENGNTYDVDIEMRGKTLLMRVYKGITLLGKTVKWELVE